MLRLVSYIPITPRVGRPDLCPYYMANRIQRIAPLLNQSSLISPYIPIQSILLPSIHIWNHSSSPLIPHPQTI